MSGEGLNQERLTEGIQLGRLYEIDDLYLPPLLPTPFPMKKGFKEIRTHEPLALFLALDNYDEVAVTTLRCRKRTRDGLIFLAAKNKDLSAADELATRRLTFAIRDPKKTKESLRRVVMVNCHARIRRCVRRMDNENMSRDEFHQAIWCYRELVSTAHDRPLEKPSRYWDKSGGAMAAFQRRMGLPDLYTSLSCLWDEVWALRHLLMMPKQVSSDVQALNDLCNRFHRLAAASSWLTISDFFERMSIKWKCPTCAWGSERAERMARMRLRLLQVAQYDMGVAELFTFMNRYPNIASTFKITWVGDPFPRPKSPSPPSPDKPAPIPTILLNGAAEDELGTKISGMRTPPGSPPKAAPQTIVRLRSSAREAADNLVQQFDMIIVDQMQYDEVFSDRYRLWRSTIPVHVHPEIKLLRHLLSVDRVQLRSHIDRRGPISLAATNGSCQSCSTYVDQINPPQRVEGSKKMFWLQGPIYQSITEQDVSFQLPGLPEDGSYVSDVLENLVIQCEDFISSSDPEDWDEDISMQEVMLNSARLSTPDPTPRATHPGLPPSQPPSPPLVTPATT